MAVVESKINSEIQNIPSFSWSGWWATFCQNLHYFFDEGAYRREEMKQHDLKVIFCPRGNHDESFEYTVRRVSQNDQA